MEKFVVLRTVTDQSMANQACAALEEADVAVMLEHITIDHGSAVASGFRILVPDQHIHTAQSIVERIIRSYQASYYSEVSSRSMRVEKQVA